MADIVQIEGFHGTSKSAANAILVEGYKPSLGINQWIGDGVYLFVDGIGEGLLNAKDWAIYKAWNNKTKHNIYPYYAVIQSSIEVSEDKMLDLTTQEGVDVFNYIIKRCTDKLKELGKNKVYIDGYVINFGRNELKLTIDVVKTNVYIKLRQSDRTQHLLRRVPNCTICAVADYTTIKSNKIVKTGRVEE